MRGQAAVLVAVLSLAPGCFAKKYITPEHVEQWCNVYTQGSAFATMVLPTLGMAVGDSPAYQAAVATFNRVNGPILNYCLQHESGTEVTEAEIAADMAEGTHALGQIIDMHEQARGMAPAVRGTRGVRVAEAPPVGAPSTAALWAELRKAEAQAVAVTARRR